MKTSLRGNRTSRAAWIMVSAGAGLLLGLAGVGMFYWSCQQQSGGYDLSVLANTPGRVRLAEIPQPIVEAAARQDDLIPSRVLAETQFNLRGDALRTRVVRGMVATLIEQKFSQREVAEFYFNLVTPGATVLHRLVRTEKAQPDVTPVSNVAPTAPVAAPVQASIPAEMTSLPSAEEAPLPVRRAVAVDKPVLRALPVVATQPYAPAVALDKPVRRAAPLSNQSRMSTSALEAMGSVIPRATPVATATVSPETIYRVAVVDR